MTSDSLGLEGHAIGNFLVDAYIGQGLTGFVYRAHAVADPTEVVALKFFIPAQGTSEAARETLYRRFEREADILSQFHHPNILTIRSFGKSDNLLYLVLPFASGGTFTDRIAKGQLPLAECAILLSQIASGLDYAHQRDVIHRDIKPSNILLDGAGAPLIADFSIAKRLDDSTTSSLTMGNVVGTLQYMSPEQSGSEPLTGATDTYSLGVVAYQMVTGDLPFHMDTMPQFFAQLLNQAPPPPTRLRPDLPAPAAAAIQRALAKVPGDRFATAGAFADAFARGVRGEWSEGLYPQPIARVSTPLAESPTILATPSGSAGVKPTSFTAAWPRMLWFGAGMTLVLLLALFSVGLVNAFSHNRGTTGPGGVATSATNTSTTGLTTATADPPIATSIPPTIIPSQPTATATTAPIQPTVTAVPGQPPTAIPPTATPMPPTATPMPPTATPIPPTPTSTPVPQPSLNVLTLSCPGSGTGSYTPYQPVQISNSGQANLSWSITDDNPYNVVMIPAYGNLQPGGVIVVRSFDTGSISSNSPLLVTISSNAGNWTGPLYFCA